MSDFVRVDTDKSVRMLKMFIRERGDAMSFRGSSVGSVFLFPGEFETLMAVGGYADRNASDFAWLMLDWVAKGLINVPSGLKLSFLEESTSDDDGGPGYSIVYVDDDGQEFYPVD